MHLKDFYIIDIDGVLADIGDRDPHDPSLYCNDTTRPSIVCFMQMVKHAGRERGDNYKSLIYLVSGRERKYERQLEIWLRYYGLDQYVDGWYLAPDKKV